ncbi:MAG: hypothetical protein O2991_01790 [Bacteroidetes bacterium]|nr:hypothetical protein [Bacteroidota bacterium]MDA0907750.1 hypothetical protein [Bacteroidota bacterium]
MKHTLWTWLVRAGLAEDESGEIAGKKRGTQTRTQRLIAMGISLGIAIILWMLVNLNNTYTTELEVALRLTELPENEVLVTEWPEVATAEVTAEGWQLVSMATNRPVVDVALGDTPSQLNVQALVMTELSSFPGLSTQRVNPVSLALDYEPKVTKKVPIRPAIQLRYEQQHGPFGPWSVQPDSVRITGGQSVVEALEFWSTVDLSLDDVRQTVIRAIPLASAHNGLELDVEAVQFEQPVKQFTEGELTLSIDILGAPLGKEYTLDPSSVTVRFLVPVDQYQDVMQRRPVRAVLAYDVIEDDQTGFVQPEIQKTSEAFVLDWLGVTPVQVAYYDVINP